MGWSGRCGTPQMERKLLERIAYAPRPSSPGRRAPGYPPASRGATAGRRGGGRGRGGAWWAKLAWAAASLHGFRPVGVGFL